MMTLPVRLDAPIRARARSATVRQRAYWHRCSVRTGPPHDAAALLGRPPLALPARGRATVRRAIGRSSADAPSLAAACDRAARGVSPRAARPRAWPLPRPDSRFRTDRGRSRARLGPWARSISARSLGRSDAPGCSPTLRHGSADFDDVPMRGSAGVRRGAPPPDDGGWSGPGLAAPWAAWPGPDRPRPSRRGRARGARRARRVGSDCLARGCAPDECRIAAARRSRCRSSTPRRLVARAELRRRAVVPARGAPGRDGRRSWGRRDRAWRSGQGGHRGARRSRAAACAWGHAVGPRMRRARAAAGRGATRMRGRRRIRCAHLVTGLAGDGRGDPVARALSAGAVALVRVAWLRAGESSTRTGAAGVARRARCAADARGYGVRPIAAASRLRVAAARPGVAARAAGRCRQQR
jgi:hypothetical protein